MALPRRLLTLSRPCMRSYRSNIHPGIRRPFSVEAASHPSNRVQAYISRSSDPYLNLSIEHFLLRKSSPGSVVLFLYTNRPCVIFGRNQNPWVEVNLGLLKQPKNIISGVSHGNGCGNVEDNQVLLVRRRSGGGTVFHDFGNMNYSVICPPASFDRNKHAHMVVRALSSLSIPDTSFRVNERHDIVLDTPSSPQTQAFKISGSAYKLIRERSLHHGTCLLSSPNLDLVGPLLRSPAEPYIKRRGVESVRSAIRNVGVTDLASFEEALLVEFSSMYGAVDPVIIGTLDAKKILDEEPIVAKGYAELKSPEWIYAQTPQFTFSTHPISGDPRPRPDLPATLPPSLRATMTVRHGQITEVSGSELFAPLNSTYLHQVTDWRSRIKDEFIGDWLNTLFGVAPLQT